MPIDRRFVLGTVVAFLFFPCAARAQGFTGDILIPPALYAVVDAPFTADTEMVRTETLADQTHITHRIVGRVLRDSAGRQRYEQGRDEAFYSSQLPPVRIYDVVTRAVIQIDDTHSMASIFPMGATSTEPIRVPASAKPIAWQVDNRPPETHVSESLPNRQIAGLTARGSRTIYTIPAGREGNDNDLYVVDELWTSSEYRMPLMHVHDDPRHGHTVFQVTRFVPGEPDASLFKVPAGYQVNDRRPRQTPPPAPAPSPKE